MRYRIQEITPWVLTLVILGGCGGSSGNAVPPVPPAPPATIQIEGFIYDGPVVGGSLHIFSADQVNAAIDDASAAGDRAAALAAANPIASLDRDGTDGAEFSIAVDGSLAGEPVFLVFDSQGARDESFGDRPFNMESAGLLSAAGGTTQLNVTPHTTLSSIQVRALLDPDGDGTIVDVAAIQSAINDAWNNVSAVFGTTSVGEALFAGGIDIHNTTDLDILGAASEALGFDVRAASAISNQSRNDVLYLYAADAADGAFDSIAPSEFSLTAEQEQAIIGLIEIRDLGSPMVGDVEAVSCSANAQSLRRACEFEVLDEYFIELAICAHSASEEAAATCRDDAASARVEVLDECGEVTAARLELCVAVQDAPYDPPFGASFAANFVDPSAIGDAVDVNPFFPLVVGNQWTYEGTFDEDGEEITEVVTISVTDRIKLIDGIRCRVVRDVVEIDGELIEDTDDWFAQDVDGNVWYCGEEVKDYESFDGDMPRIPELVAIDGSFKAGRDGDEAGVLIPFSPVVGDLFRQEASYANAEDAIEILATDGSETVPAASCNGNCLVTRDFSPLDPGVEENKFYIPGIGKILEVDLESGDRVELIDYTVSP